MVSNLTWIGNKMIGPWIWIVARLVLRAAQRARAEADALNDDEAELTPNPNATAAHLSPSKSALIIGSVIWRSPRRAHSLTPSGKSCRLRLWARHGQQAVLAAMHPGRLLLRAAANKN
jgi:hypothetical protein